MFYFHAIWASKKFFFSAWTQHFQLWGRYNYEIKWKHTFDLPAIPLIQWCKARFEYDQLEKDIDNYGVRILALRHPVAHDLRSVVAALKISSDLERIGDYASNISKRVKKLDEKISGDDAKVMDQLLEHTIEMLDETMVAYQHGNADLAVKSWHKDQEVDDEYVQFIRQQLEENKSKKSTEHTLQLIFIAKHIERSADHITNIAEMVYYIQTGENFEPEEA